MKITATIIFAFMCINLCTSRFAAEGKKSTWLSRGKDLFLHFKHKIYNHRWGNGTKLSDLDVDCQLLILEELDFVSLINIAEVNAVFSALAADVFKRRFAHKIMVLRERTSNIDILELNDVIIIEKFNIIAKVFNHFGPSISKVKVVYRKYENHEVEQVFELLCQYSSSFEKLHIENNNKDLLQNVQNSFENVVNVSFVGEFNELRSKTKNLSEIFPKMRYLSLGYLKVSDPTSIYSHFPHLVYLHVSFLRINQPISDHDIECLIRKNPQIQGLSIFYGSMRLFRFASENMPNLETLHLPMKLKDQMSSEDAPIHFRTVKKLVMKSLINRFPRNVTFDQLQELECGCDPSYDWFDFIAENPYLTKLHITRGEVYKRDLDEITSLLPDLTEASFICGLDIDEESVFRFLQLNKKLKKLYLKCDSKYFLTKARLKAFQAEMEWKVVQNPNSVSFEKLI